MILTGVFIFTLYFLPREENYNETRSGQIIEGENEWILQYNITNSESKDIKYTITVNVDGKVYEDSTTIKQGKTYTYIHHIYPQELTEGKVTFILYKEGSKEPVEQTTYLIYRKN